MSRDRIGQKYERIRAVRRVKSTDALIHPALKPNASQYAQSIVVTMKILSGNHNAMRANSE
jgi:hypothetical protein